MPKATEDQKTVEDRETARRTALETWLRRASEHFDEACLRRSTEPARSIEVARKVLESWAYVMRIELVRDFFPQYQRGLIRRLEMEDLLKGIALPPHIDGAVQQIRAASNPEHHAQPEPIRSLPDQAQSVLLQCVVLLEDLYGRILKRPLDGSTERHIASVRGGPKNTPAGPTLLEQPRSGAIGAAGSRTKLGVIAAVVCVAGLIGLAGVVVSVRSTVRDATADSSSAAASTPGNAPPETSASKRGIVVPICGNESAPLRRAPGMDSQILRQLPPGTEVELGKRVETPLRPGKKNPDRWFEVYLKPNEPASGWVHVDVLQSTSGDEGLRVPCFRCAGLAACQRACLPTTETACP